MALLGWEQSPGEMEQRFENCLKSTKSIFCSKGELGFTTRVVCQGAGRSL